MSKINNTFTRRLSSLSALLAAFLLQLPFAANAAVCSGVDVAPYMADGTIQTNESIEIIKRIGNLSYISDGAEAALQINLGLTKWPDGQAVYESGAVGTLNEAFGAAILALTISSHLERADFAEAGEAVAKFSAKKLLGYLAKEAFGAAAGSVLSVGIKLIVDSLDRLDSGLTKSAFKNQVKMYGHARDAGLSHQDILDSKDDPINIVYFSTDGWLVYTPEMQLDKYISAKRVGDLSPEEVYTSAQKFYDAEKSAQSNRAAVCRDVKRIVERLAASIELQITTNSGETSFSGPQEVNLQISGKLLEQFPIQSITWTSSDGNETSQSSALAPTFIYWQPKDYKVTATVVLSDGQIHDLEETIHIFPPQIQVDYPNGYL